jgi:hypothetical protein
MVEGLLMRRASIWVAGTREIVAELVNHEGGTGRRQYRLFAYQEFGVCHGQFSATPIFI